MTPLNRVAVLISAGGLVVALGASALAVTSSPRTAAATRPAAAADATCAPLDVICQAGLGGTSPSPSDAPTSEASTSAATSPSPSPSASPTADCPGDPTGLSCVILGDSSSPSPSDSPSPSAAGTASPSPSASPTDGCPGDPTGITCIITGGGSSPTASATPSASKSPSPSPARSATPSATRSASPSPAKTTAPSPSASPVANPPVSHTVKFTPVGYKSIGSAVRVRMTPGFVTVLGHGGVPATGVDQVLVFVQTSGSTATSNLRTGKTALAPTQQGLTRHALDLVRLDTSGRIPVRVDKGSTLVSISVVGYSGTSSTSAYQRIPAKKQVTTAPQTLAAGKKNVLTLALPGVPSSNRTRWAAVVHLSIKPVGSTSTGTLSATVNGTTAFKGVSSYNAGTDSTVTVVVRPTSKGTVSFKVSKGSAVITMTETAAWVPGATGTAFSTWPQGRVKAI